jgi:hypothetical protein
VSHDFVTIFILKTVVLDTLRGRGFKQISVLKRGSEPHAMAGNQYRNIYAVQEASLYKTKMAGCPFMPPLFSSENVCH